jgi:hypothetical protein
MCSTLNLLFQPSFSYVGWYTHLEVGELLYEGKLNILQNYTFVTTGEKNQPKILLKSGR